MWGAEPSFRFWSCLNVASAALAFALPLSGEGRALILALGVLVLAAEGLNTGVEAAVDRSGMEREGGPYGDCGGACLDHSDYRFGLKQFLCGSRRLILGGAA